MATVQQMKATARPKGGKGAARSARRSGNVPGVIYGENKPPIMVLIEHAELRKRIYAGRFLTTLYEIDVDGQKHRVIPRDFQLDAIKDLPMHVDFLRVAEGASIRVKIPVHVHGRRELARRQARRRGQYRHPHRRGGVPGRRHSGIDRRRHQRARHQPFQAFERSDAAEGHPRRRPSRHDAGHRGAAVRLRRRTQGRRRSCRCSRRCRRSCRCCRCRPRCRRCRPRCRARCHARCCSRWRACRRRCACRGAAPAKPEKK